MIACNDFFQKLRECGTDFFTGVPDSLLGSLSAWLLANDAENHLIAANEGNAVGLAAGHYLSTGRIPVVYLQNSGIGNIINPVASLLHRDVYQIPVLFLVGWRGEPGVSDEPQHIFQGKATISLLEDVGMRTEILCHDWETASEQIEAAYAEMKRSGGSAAFVIRKGTFAPYPFQKEDSCHPMSRERALEVIASSLPEDSVVVSTTGKLSRELFEIRERRGEGHEKDFLTVGSMGHASSIALGIARNTDKMVYCLDGDGAALMHMGAMAVLGQSKISNMKHIVINNGCHESVGGQPTVGFFVHLEEIARGCGYPSVITCETEEALAQTMQTIRERQGLEFVQVMVNAKSRSDLGRPTIGTHANKEHLMNYLLEVRDEA